MNLQQLLLSAVLILFTHYICSEELEADLSGYARLVAGVLDDSDAEYFTYDDSLTVDKDSLLGLQGKLLFNDKLSATALGLLHSDSEIDSGLEWVYLGYRPINPLKIKIGKMQTPFYALSDSLDVGYSYPWVNPPEEVYTDFIFRYFEGIDLRYSHVVNGYSAHFEAYYGNFDDSIGAFGEDVNIEANDLQGLIAELRIDNFEFRASYHTTHLSADWPAVDLLAQQLSLAGFVNNAKILDISNQEVDFFQLSASYETLNYFLKAEGIKLEVEADGILPDTRGYYLSYGYYLGNLTLHATYGNRKDSLQALTNEVPIGLSPQLDQLSFGFQTLIDSVEKIESESWAVGLRWDFRTNMAFKFDVKHIESKGGEGSIFDIEDPDNFDNKAVLFSIALDLVF